MGWRSLFRHDRRVVQTDDAKELEQLRRAKIRLRLLDLKADIIVRRIRG